LPAAGQFAFGEKLGWILSTVSDAVRVHAGRVAGWDHVASVRTTPSTMSNEVQGGLDRTMRLATRRWYRGTVFAWVDSGVFIPFGNFSGLVFRGARIVAALGSCAWRGCRETARRVEPISGRRLEEVCRRRDRGERVLLPCVPPAELLLVRPRPTAENRRSFQSKIMDSPRRGRNGGNSGTRFQ